MKVNLARDVLSSKSGQCLRRKNALGTSKYVLLFTRYKFLRVLLRCTYAGLIATMQVFL